MNFADLELMTRINRQLEEELLKNYRKMGLPDRQIFPLIRRIIWGR